MTKPSVISKEKILSLFLTVILFLSCRNLPKARKLSTSAEIVMEFKSTVVLPYVKALSEQLRRCLQQLNYLRSQLVRPEDAVDPAKQEGVV